MKSSCFKRVIAVAKGSNRAVSEVLGIDDRYIAYCIDETALYVEMKSHNSGRESEPAKENDGNKLLAKLAKKKRK